jgi:SHS2 domain-containing protein
MNRGMERGHRVVDHTADQILEAWAPTRAGCLEEVVEGFVALFAATGDAGASSTTTVRLDGADDRRLLLALLDELVYLLDAGGVVPVGSRVHDRGEEVRVELDLVEVSSVEEAGPSPKGVSHSGLALSSDGERWQARALVDI